MAQEAEPQKEPAACARAGGTNGVMRDRGVTALQKRADAPHPAVLQNVTVDDHCVPRAQATRV